MFAEGVKIRSFNAGCAHEILLPGGKRVLIDPFFQDSLSGGHTLEEVEGADYVLVTHTHFDHELDLGYFAERYRPLIFVGALSAQALVRYHRLAYDHVVPVYPGQTYTVEDFKLEIIAAKHNPSGGRTWDPETDIVREAKGVEGHRECDVCGDLESVDYLLITAGAKHIIACDENGILYKDRGVGIKDHKKMLCEITNEENRTGTLSDALEGADVFIGVSVAGALKPEMIKKMAADPIVFAMANPTPEIMYDEAIAAGVKVMGTGRSDFPNQVNNVLAFPGIFRGALDAGARDINDAMKLAAAQAIADLVEPEKLCPEYIIPSVLDPRVAPYVAEKVAEAAVKSGAVRG